jgi:hypothetical protein
MLSWTINTSEKVNVKWDTSATSSPLHHVRQVTVIVKFWHCTHQRRVSFSSFWQIECCAPKTEKHTMECAPTCQEQIFGTKRPLAKCTITLRTLPFSKQNTWWNGMIARPLAKQAKIWDTHNRHVCFLTKQAPSQLAPKLCALLHKEPSKTL